MGLLWPKPTSKRIERRREKQRRADLIAAVRREVVVRDAGRCRACQCLLTGFSGGGEMHELRSRALMRGKPPEEIFNTNNCLMLCSECHRNITNHVADLIPEDADLGADGAMVLQGRDDTLGADRSVEFRER